MACFVYEALILFGLGLVPGLVGALVLSHAGQPPSPHGENALRAFAFLFYGVYFVGFWSARGQTLPMQTWNIRVEALDGALCGKARAALRYVAAWVWIVPGVLVAAALRLTPWQSLGAVAVWVVVYAVSSRLNPTRQFWHDTLCRTRLVDFKPPPRPRNATPPAA